MLSFFKKFLGSKSQRDIKAIMPVVEQIHEVYKEIQKLSNDELRAKTQEFKNRIANYIAEEESKIAELKASIENEIEMDVEEKAEIYKQIDALSKLSYQKSQKILDEILPEAFAVMKDTARRFYENEKVVVTATQMDRDLAAHFDNIQIEGDKAIYKNQWMAGGNLITWDMVHYDV